MWQSFQHDIQLGNAYVERGHVGVANENAWKDYGRTYLDLPEGLDTGKAMVVTGQQYKSLIGETNGYTTFGVIVASTTKLDTDPGTADAPKITCADGSAFENHTNGTALYYFSDALDFLAVMMSGAEYPWMTQGICGIYAIPRLPEALLETKASQACSSII